LISPAGLAPHPPSEKHLKPSEIHSNTMSIIGRFWNLNGTPQSLVRLIGPFGPGLVHRATLRRFGKDRWGVNETQLISEYLYQMSSLPASGEDSLNAILMPIVVQHTSDPNSQRPHVYTRQPIMPQQLSPVLVKTVSTDEATRVAKIPLLIMYGDNDWVKFTGVNEYVKELHSHNIDADLSIIKNAGHHLYMDNVEDLHGEIDKWLAKVYVPTDTSSSSLSSSSNQL
jgi:pimeloyl-ACP methyl ester carboxylesterase